MSVSSSLPFEYTVRARALRNLDGAEYSRVAEQRDRELEDFLGQLIADIGESTLAVGSIHEFFGSTAPVQYLRCNGTTFSAVTYPELAAQLGGTTLPNLAGSAAGVIKCIRAVP